MFSNRGPMLAIAMLLALALAQAVCAKTPEEALKARHQQLFAAYNQRDVKALRAFYTPDYRYEERGGHKITLDRYMKGFGEIFKSLPKPGQDKATLTQIVIKNDTATRGMTLRLVWQNGETCLPVPSEDALLQRAVSVEGAHGSYVRAELVKPNGSMAALTNPIYLRCGP